MRIDAKPLAYLYIEEVFFHEYRLMVQWLSAVDKVSALKIGKSLVQWRHEKVIPISQGNKVTLY